MQADEYQLKAMTFRQSSTMGDCKVIYPTIGLAGEAGEVADKVKKVIRDHDSNFDNPELTYEIILEIGDVMWYAAALAHDLGYTLNEVLEMNIDKLSNRRLRNMIKGSGDHR